MCVLGLGCNTNRYNACIFAYGQTGTGKTHTMEGTEADRGLMFRALHTLFSTASSGLYGAGPSASYQFTVTLVEVYNDRITDLLSDETKVLLLRAVSNA